MKKKLLGILLICGMLITMVPFALPASAARPTAITTADELAALMADSSKWSGDYILMSDIDLTGKTQAPIGNVETPFTGTFDGNRHTVSGVDLTGGTEKRWGFFGCISGATIENLTIEGAIKSTGDGVGGIVGCIVTGGGTIRNCVNKCSVITTNQRAGGIIGVVLCNAESISVTIENCKNYGAITAPMAAGGIAGRLDCNRKNGTSITVENCANYGAVTATQTGGASGNGAGNAGGIVGTAIGRIGSVAIENCYNHGSVKGWEVGGVAAYFTASAPELFRIKNCLNDGALTIYDKGYVGGIIGYAVFSVPEIGYVQVTDCVNLGAITRLGASSYYNAICGVWRDGTELKNCYYASTIPADEKAISVPEADLALEASYPALDFDSTWTMTKAGPMLTKFWRSTTYFSYDGADTNDGLTESTPVKTWAKATQIMNGKGGNLVLVGKGYMGASFDFPAQTAPVIITANGAFTPGDNVGNFMLENSNSATLTVNSELIFDNVGIVSRATKENTILVKSGATLTITDTVAFSEKAGGTYIHYKLVLEEGATAYLSEEAQKWLTIENRGGDLYNYGKETGLYGNVRLAADPELVYNGTAQAALELPEGVTLKKSDAKAVGTYTDHTVVLTADGYRDYTILVPETTITPAELTVSNLRTKKGTVGMKIDYTLTGVVGTEKVWLMAPAFFWDAENEICIAFIMLEGADKDNYTLATALCPIDISETASKYTVKYFKDGKEVSDDTVERLSVMSVTLTEEKLEALKKDYEGYELDSITDAEGNPIKTPLLVEGENTVICYNYKTPKEEGGEGGEGEESEQLKALKTVALVTTVRKNYVRNTITTINFVTRGGERLPSITGVRGGMVELPTPANKPGYTFGGWYMDTNCTRPYTANTALSGAVTLYARWVKN